MCPPYYYKLQCTLPPHFCRCDDASLFPAPLSLSLPLTTPVTICRPPTHHASPLPPPSQPLSSYVYRTIAKNSVVSFSLFVSPFCVDSTAS